MGVRLGIWGVNGDAGWEVRFCFFGLYMVWIIRYVHPMLFGRYLDLSSPTDDATSLWWLSDGGSRNGARISCVLAATTRCAALGICLLLQPQGQPVEKVVDSACSGLRAGRSGR